MMTKYKYQVKIAEVYLQTYEFESEQKMDVDTCIEHIYNNGIEPVENELEYSHIDIEQSYLSKRTIEDDENI